MFSCPFLCIFGNDSYVLMRKNFTIILTACAIFYRCTPPHLKSALRELDQVIKESAFYQEEFEHRNDSLRNCLSSGSWESANALFQSYLHFSADSAGRYIAIMEKRAGNQKQSLKTTIDKCYLLGTAHYEESALALFQSLDAKEVQEAGLSQDYLRTGIKIFTNLSRFSHPLQKDRGFSDSLNVYRNTFIAQDTVSYEGRKLLAQSLRDKGETQRALSIFQACFNDTAETDYHQLTSIAYNMARLYGMEGDDESKQTWLAKSAIYDFKASNRDFLSLYELALTLYKERDYERAGRYISAHLGNVYAGDFQAQVIRSSGAQNIIVEAALRAERQKQTVQVIAIIVLVIFALFILWLLVIRHNQAIKLSKANKALEEVNSALTNANKIKDNYVFRYIDLSAKYLDKIEEYRHQLRQIARNQGTDALLKELRNAANYADYKEFYRIFDQTFLGIFPGFVAGVNALLQEDARFVCTPDNALPTEIRILASIRLGIDESPHIASFLKCSLSTVYTYRAKMRNRALCPKDEFEQRVRELV